MRAAGRVPQADTPQAADGTVDALLWVHPGAWHEAKAVLAAASLQHGVTFATRCTASCKLAVVKASALQASVGAPYKPAVVEPSPLRASAVWSMACAHGLFLCSTCTHLQKGLACLVPHWASSHVTASIRQPSVQYICNTLSRAWSAGCTICGALSCVGLDVMQRCSRP